MLRVTRRLVRRRVRRLTPPTLFGLAGLPGFASTAALRPAVAIPRVDVRSDFTNCLRFSYLLLKIKLACDGDLLGAIGSLEIKEISGKIGRGIPIHKYDRSRRSPVPFSAERHFAG